MPTVHLFPVATTTAGVPRTSSSINYSGGSDRTVLLQLVCPTWASADPAQVVTLSVEQSFDNGVTWAQFCGMSSHAGRVNRVGGLPSVNCQCNDGLGLRKVRAVLSVDTGSLDIGADATT
jgi:hypothetical protein